MHILWDLALGWNLVWATLCALLVGAAVSWSSVRCVRIAWHRANAEAMARAVEDTTETEALCQSLSAAKAQMARLTWQAQAARQAGSSCEDAREP